MNSIFTWNTILAAFWAVVLLIGRQIELGFIGGEGVAGELAHRSSISIPSREIFGIAGGQKIKKGGAGLALPFRAWPEPMGSDPLGLSRAALAAL